MAGRQQRNAADAGDDRPLELDGAAGHQLLDQPDRAVVERRVAPHEDRRALAVPDARGHRLLQRRHPLGVPCRDALLVGHAVVPGAIGDLDDPVGLRGEAVDDLPAVRREIGLGLALVDDEEDVDLPHRLDRLDRQQLGRAGPDTDQEETAHVSGVDGASTGRVVGDVSGARR